MPTAAPLAPPPCASASAGATAATRDTCATSNLLPRGPPLQESLSADAAAYRLHYVFVDEHLIAKANTLDQCSYFGFYLLFLVGFCLYFLYDVDVSGCSQLRHSLLDTLTQTPYSPLKSVSYFADVSNARGFGEYVVDVVAPLTANVFYPTGSSIILGAMRLRTQRSGGSVGHEGDNAMVGLMHLYHSIDCADDCLSAAVEDTGVAGTLYSRERNWHYYSCYSLSGSHWLRLYGYLQSYHCGGFLFDVPMWLNRTTENTSMSEDNPHRSGVHGERNCNDGGDKIGVLTVAARCGSSLSCAASSSMSSGACSAAPSLGTAEQAFPFADGTLPYERISLQVVQESYLRPILWGMSAPFLDDDATRVAVVELLFYNPPLQRFAAVKLVGEVTLGGSWKTTGRFATARVWTRDDVGKTAYDAVVMALGLVWICVFVRDVGQFVVARMKAQRFACYTDSYEVSSSGATCTPRLAAVWGLLEFFSRSWNLMTLVILCLLVVTSGCRVAAVVHSVRGVPTLDSMIRRASYPMEVEYLLMMDRLQLYLNASVTILIFYRALYYVSLESRAALVMRVLSHARSALIGCLFTALFLSTVLAMTLGALYGNTVWAFHNIDASLNTLLRVLARQQSMSALASGTLDSLGLAFALFAFVFVCGLVLINLSLGIVAHAFAEVRKAEPVSDRRAYQTRWVLQRTWKCMRNPREWPILVLRWWAGRGDAALLRHAAQSLRSYRAARFPVLDHITDELGQLLSEAEFNEAMSLPMDLPFFPDRLTAQGSPRRSSSGGSAVAHAGGNGLLTAASSLSEKEREELRVSWRQRWRFYSPADLWRDIVEDWLASTTSEASRAYQEEHTWLRSGVQAAVRDRLALLNEFPQRLAVLERKLESLESHSLENRPSNDTSVAVEKASPKEDAAPSF
ncbi:hypothetical protein JKF63_00506 [Porcisia hertigi]|uniref:Polycystin cation channel PKD1/PKD2 domain-containing protein n=1 Tax=Porcisia hertigi TaxID=2761500 RepID=A0A836KX53_9TRYP|nr:hypothetical protein JKF63_00506 [Porcisia hertigi]